MRSDVLDGLSVCNQVFDLSRELRPAREEVVTLLSANIRVKPLDLADIPATFVMLSDGYCCSREATDTS